MEANFWIRIEAKKVDSRFEACRIQSFKNKPTTRINEVVFKVRFCIPDSFFETPQLCAVIEIPEYAVTFPVIDAEVQDNIAEEISRQLGMRVHISVPETNDGQEDPTG